ncbi:MAG: hypothetical protein ACI9VR_002897 [Cognaticolwellia sp.]|jgi:hypothetical protein
MTVRLEAAQDARHDLGKYICINQRWLGEQSALSERIEALQADLLRTQSGPGGTVDAFALWARLRPPLEGAGSELAEVDAAISRLESHRGAIEKATLNQATLAACTADCKAIADALKRLTRRLQKES